MWEAAFWLWLRLLIEQHSRLVYNGDVTPLGAPRFAFSTMLCCTLCPWFLRALALKFRSNAAVSPRHAPPVAWSWCTAARAVLVLVHRNFTLAAASAPTTQL